MKCPENLNVEDLIVRMDKKDTYKQYKKADAYCKYVDDLIASFILLNDAREDALKYLKYTTVFYTTQNEEVKKVVHAYRIYGKKLKIMEKALSEKMSGLRELFPSPIPESPISDNSIEFSLPSDSPTLDSNPELVNTVDDSQNSPSSNTECTEDSSHEIYVPGESPSENAEVTESICLKDAGSLSATDEKDVPNMEVTSFDVPFRQEDSDISDEKSNVDSNIMDSELKVKSDVATPAEGDSTDIDFLLEKAYDERKGKKANIKRKNRKFVES
ncbi:uncharacterized protein LOC129225771 [Uloborus diversus]|uniref:uncharacterized protein LOC129225771 n=1 Tax=Uloborus diversus TaxID=327109 RepID=UPI0024097ED1|nr:uncharacterized protein LOC129225771 [Uloborus diversus]